MYRSWLIRVRRLSIVRKKTGKGEKKIRITKKMRKGRRKQR
jgi:hypothetical protein